MAEVNGVSNATACPEIPKILKGKQGYKVSIKNIHEYSYDPNGGTYPRNDKPANVFDCDLDGNCVDTYGKKANMDDIAKGIRDTTPKKEGFWNKLFGGSEEQPKSDALVRSQIGNSLTDCTQQLVGDEGTVTETSTIRDGKRWNLTYIETNLKGDNPDDPIKSRKIIVSPWNQE